MGVSGCKGKAAPLLTKEGLISPNMFAANVLGDKNQNYKNDL